MTQQNRIFLLKTKMVALILALLAAMTALGTSMVEIRAAENPAQTSGTPTECSETIMNA